jgi:hypothetical protein
MRRSARASAADGPAWNGRLRVRPAIYAWTAARARKSAAPRNAFRDYPASPPPGQDSPARHGVSPAPFHRLCTQPGSDPCTRACPYSHSSMSALSARCRPALLAARRRSVSPRRSPRNVGRVRACASGSCRSRTAQSANATGNRYAGARRRCGMKLRPRSRPRW